MGEMINDEERAGGREPWVGVGGPWMEGVRGGWAVVHTPRAQVPPA